MEPAEVKELVDQAYNEVLHRLRRQPFPKPQFTRGVESGLRWFMEALDARLESIDPKP